MIPLATTTVAVLRPPAADDYAEPYSGTRTAGHVDLDALDEIAVGVRAVIDAVTGTEAVAGGEQTQTVLKFISDEADIKPQDYLKDEVAGGQLYRIVWCVRYAGEHVEGGLKLVEGLV